MRLSIVIPTRNRLSALRNTLGALAAQEIGEHEAEIVVVDNGSSDGTVEWLDDRRTDFPMPLQVVSEPTLGVSAARNAGVRQAQHDHILFLNDDTAPADHALVAGHARAHEIAANPPIAVLGRITYPPEQLTDPFMRWLNDGAQFDYGSLDRGVPPSAPHFFTAHISFPRAPFEHAGGMDERLLFGYDDAALGHRMAQQEVSIRYHPDLVVYHDHPMDISTWRRKATANGRAGRHINALYPVSPPLARDIPATPYWRAVEIAARVLALGPAGWAWLPQGLRERVYLAVNGGAYARGYRLGTERE
jgi:glycosyltransferase involved in cell wall biosynthesis